MDDSSSDCSTSSSFDCLDSQFTFELHIECNPPPPNPALELADKKSKVTKIERGPIYYFTPNGDHLELTDHQLDSIAYPHPQITLCVKKYPHYTSYLQETFNATNATYFTVKNLVDCLIEFEKKAREHRRIGGLINLSHRHFCNLLPTEDGCYEIVYD